MWLELFLCLMLAHLVADFVLQSNKVCKDKAEKKWKCWYHYAHALIVCGLAWLVSWSWDFLWCALVIGVTHFAIDMWKSYREENVTWFAVDQMLHIAMMAGVAWMWCSMNDWSMPVDVALYYVAMTIAIIVCWKPSNIFIKLILVFVLLQRYDAIGLLIAAKSIIRFGDKETTKTEYVLAGTLMSIFIAVLAGVMVTMVK